MATKTRKLPNKTEPIELFMTLQDQERIAVRALILQCLHKETVGHVRNKIGDAVAEIGRQYSDAGMFTFY